MSEADTRALVDAGASARTAGNWDMAAPSPHDASVIPAAVSAASSPSYEKTRRRTVFLYIATVILLYGLSMFVNSVAVRLIPPSASAIAVRCYALGGAPVALGTWLLVVISAPMYCLAAGRAMTLFFIYIAMLWWGGRRVSPPATAAAARSPGGSVRGAASLKQLSIPVAIGVINCIAYASFVALTSLSAVSIWSAMIGLFAVLPVSYGIIVRGESRSPRKLCGVAACIAAAVLLGLSSEQQDAIAPPAAGSGPAEPTLHAPLWVKFLLYASATCCWSLSDGLSAYVLAPPMPPKAAASPDLGGVSGGAVPAPPSARAPTPALPLTASSVSAGAAALSADAGVAVSSCAVLPMHTVTLFTGIGFVCVAACLGGLNMLLSARIALPIGPPWSPPVVECFRDELALAEAITAGVYAGGLLLVFLAQVMGMVAWVSLVQLGTVSEASSFIPLIALDVFVPVVLGILVLGERISSLGYFGIALSCVGIGLVSASA